MVIIVYNIQFQICGLIMVSMVMFFYFFNKSLQIFSERMFSFLLIAVFFCLVLDISSILFINWRHSIPSLYVDFVCKSYIISITTVAFITRLYVYFNITNKRPEIKHQFYYAIPLIINIIVCYIFPIRYYANEGQIYTYGIIINITYICVAIYLIFCIFNILRSRKIMKKNNFMAISFLLSAWIITAIMQFIKSEWLLVGFAMAAAMVFMFLCMENPTQNIDSLTGMFNQSAYHHYINSLCSQHKQFVLVLIKIKDMGFMNETFGIQNADKLLRDIGNYLEGNIEGNIEGKVFRDLGTKFSLVIDGNFEEVPDMVSNLLNRFEFPWKISRLEYNAGISIVELHASDCDFIPERIIEFSRHFLSKLKRSKEENYLKVTKEMIQEKEKNYMIERTLKRVIQNKDIQVFYQPIYSIKEQKYVSAEALTRIKDEAGNYIRPDLFINVAEQNGMILELGMLIFEEVCKFISQNSLEEMGLQYIEINLSVVQCMQEKLADELIELMYKYEIPPHFINLEITETAAANSKSILQKNMDKLIAKGVTFSLDDYGTGYSNISYVINLPVNLIKIDRSMVQAYCNAEKAKIAMEFTISMIKKLGFKIVAEGVETQEELDKVKTLDIDYIQGFYFSKALEKMDFMDELSKRRENDEL